MSERIDQINADLEYWQTRKSEAIQVILEANDKILQLASERNGLLGRTATRHLQVVPPPAGPDYPNGAA